MNQSQCGRVESSRNLQSNTWNISITIFSDYSPSVMSEKLLHLIMCIRGNNPADMPHVYSCISMSLIFKSPETQHLWDSMIGTRTMEVGDWSQPFMALRFAQRKSYRPLAFEVAFKARASSPTLMVCTDFSTWWPFDVVLLGVCLKCCSFSTFNHIGHSMTPNGGTFSQQVLLENTKFV